MSEPYALERKLAERFAAERGLSPAQRDALAVFLAAYRDELQTTWKELAVIAAKRGV
jgi:dsDNA-binding SOS-regulon protein